MTWNFPPWFGAALVAVAALMLALHLVALIGCLRSQPRGWAVIASALLGFGWAWLALSAGSSAWPAAFPAALFATLAVRARVRASGTPMASVWPLVGAGVALAIGLVSVPAFLRHREALGYEARSQEYADENQRRCEAIYARFDLTACTDLPSATQTGPYEDGPDAGASFWFEQRCASTYYNASYVLTDPTDDHPVADENYWAERAARFVDELTGCVENPKSLQEMSAVLRAQRHLKDLPLADEQVGFRVTLEPLESGGIRLVVFNGANQ